MEISKAIDVLSEVILPKPLCKIKVTKEDVISSILLATEALKKQQQIEELECKMPEKRLPYTNTNYHTDIADVNKGFNECHDLLTPIIQKQALRIQELECELGEYHNENYRAGCDITNLQQENQELRDKLKEK